MVAVFATFDCPSYHRLLLQDLADLLQAPNAKNDGGFSASLCGRFLHDVALDKAHEMLINKEVKKVTANCQKGVYNRWQATELPVL